MNDVNSEDHVSSDILLNRVKHTLRKSGSAGASMRVLLNRLKGTSEDDVAKRLAWLQSKGWVEKETRERVYNGLPVVAFVWIGG